MLFWSCCDLSIFYCLVYFFIFGSSFLLLFFFFDCFLFGVVEGLTLEQSLSLPGHISKCFLFSFNFFVWKVILNPSRNFEVHVICQMFYLVDVGSFSNFFSSSFGEISFCINLMASICICTGMAAAKGRGNHLRIFVKTPEYPLFGSCANSWSNCLIVPVYNPWSLYELAHVQSLGVL